MIRRNCSYVFTVAIAAVAVNSVSVYAQGLIFNLPEDGTGVEYQGTLVQETVRPDLPDGKETLSWARELTIKSVGRENAEYQGKMQPCRWIEVKIVTGTAGAAGLDPGPVGDRVYKVLVPESKVSDQPRDKDMIPNSVLPIVKGYRRLGEEPVEEITSRGLVFYPTLCLLANYEDPKTVAASERVETVDGRDSFAARHLKGTTVRERRDARSTNEADFWVSRDVPFGLAGWFVKLTRESKASTEARDNFQVVSTITCNMKVKGLQDSAESELETD